MVTKLCVAMVTKLCVAMATIICVAMVTVNCVAMVTKLCVELWPVATYFTSATLVVMVTTLLQNLSTERGFLSTTAFL